MKRINETHFGLLFLFLGLTANSFSQTQTPIFTPTPGLSVVKTVNYANFTVGQTILYTLTINNYLTGSTQNNLTVVDTLPPGFVLVNYETTDIIPNPAVSPALPITGPSPVTFGPFSMANNTTGHINLQVQVGGSSSNGSVQTVTNAVTLFQNNNPVNNSNSIGQACYGAAVSFAFTPGTTPLQGNSMCFNNSNNGYVVGNDGYIGYWNGSTLATVPSGTTNNLLGDSCCTSSSSTPYDVIVGQNRTVLVNQNNGPFSLLTGVPFFEADNDSDDHPGSTDPDDEVDFTSVDVLPNCGGVYVTASDGAVLYCSSTANLLSTNGACLTPIYGGGGPANTTHYCGPNTMDHLNTVEVTNDGDWLLIGGYFVNHGVTQTVLEYAGPPAPTACTSFTPASTVALDGSVNDIKQLPTGEIYAVGNNGAVYFSNNETPGTPPTFTNINAGGELGIPTTIELLSVDGFNNNNVIIGGTDGWVFLYNGTGIQSFHTTMGNIQAVEAIYAPNGTPAGYGILCEGVYTFACLPTPQLTETPFFTTTPTPTYTPSVTVSRTPTSLIATSTFTFIPSPTNTPTPTFTFSGAGGGTSTFSPIFTSAITATFTITPTFTPFGFSGSATSTFSSTSTSIPTAFLTDTPTPTPFGVVGTAIATATFSFTFVPTSFSTLTNTPTFTPFETGSGGTFTLTTTPTPSIHTNLNGLCCLCCFDPSGDTLRTIAVGDDGSVIVRNENRVTGESTIQIIPVVVTSVNGTPVAPYTVHSNLNAILCCSANKWVIVGENGTVLVTENGGTTWEQINLAPFTTPAEPPSFFANLDLTAVTGDITCTHIQITSNNGAFWQLNIDSTVSGIGGSVGAAAALFFNPICTVPTNPANYTGPNVDFY